MTKIQARRLMQAVVASVVFDAMEGSQEAISYVKSFCFDELCAMAGMEPNVFRNALDRKGVL